MTTYNKDIDFNADCNCASNSPQDPPVYQGVKGTTVWKSNANPIYIAPSGYPNDSYTISFTDTGPQYGGQTDGCLLMYRVHTSEDSEYPAVRLTTTFNDLNSGEVYHSKRSNHDIKEVVDLRLIHYTENEQDIYVYRFTEPNVYTFTNNSDVEVQLWDLKIFRAYAMTELSGQSPGSRPNDYGVDGNLDYTREDYPCNYYSYGKRYSFTYFGGEDSCQEVGNEIAAGDTFSWTFVNPPAPPSGPANYLDRIACFFNFNNTTCSGASTNQDDIHYVIELNDTIIEHFYLPSKDENYALDGAQQFPGVDLALYGSLYNEQPNESNVVKIYHVESAPVKLKLVDGGCGRINVYRFYEVANICQDNFSEVNMSSPIWQTLSTTYGEVNETNGQLQVTINEGGSGWDQAGYVTKYAYNTHDQYGSNQQGFEAAIDVANMDQLLEMSLLISTDNPTTNSDPYFLNNWYRITKGLDSTINVENRIGGTYSRKFQAGWAGSTGQLKIKVSTGSIAFYENGILRYAEPYALPSDDCYIYAYTSTTESYPGTDTFDNYALKPAEIFRDEFKDGNYNGWVVDDGSWGIQNGQLRSYEYYSHIHYYTTFSANRHVRADIQTLSSDGVNPWDVAWLKVKEQDGNNRVYALIRTDGKVELTMIYNGQMTIWQVQSGLNPHNLHRISVSVIGSNAKLWVDGTLYIDVSNNNLANLAGYAGLWTVGSTAAYDNIAVFSQ